MATLKSDAAALDEIGMIAERVDASAIDATDSSPSSRRLSSKTIHLFALTDQAIVSGANFLTTMVLARGLSLAEFGKYSLLWMFILFGANVQMAFIVAPMMSIGPIQKRMSEGSYLGSIFSFQIALAAAFTLLLAAGIGVLRYMGSSVDRSWVVPIMIANAAYQLQDFTRRVFFYRKRVVAALCVDSISYIGQLLTIWVCMRFHMLSVTSVLWVNALTSILAIGVALPLMPLPIGRLNILRLALIRNWRSARYTLAATLLQWTSGNLFILMAPLFVEVSVVGAMRACQSIMNMTNIWMQGLENSLPSEASRIFVASGSIGLKRYIVRSLIVLGGVTAIIAVIISVAPEFWLSLIYGPHLKGYGFVLRAYGVVAFLIMLTLPLRAGLRSLENTRPIFVGYVITTVYSVISAPLLTHYFGLEGILVGIIGTQLLLIPVLIFSLQRTLSHEPLR